MSNHSDLDLESLDTFPDQQIATVSNLNDIIEESSTANIDDLIDFAEEENLAARISHKWSTFKFNQDIADQFGALIEIKNLIERYEKGFGHPNKQKYLNSSCKILSIQSLPILQDLFNVDLLECINYFTPIENNGWETMTLALGLPATSFLKTKLAALDMLCRFGWDEVTKTGIS